MGEHDALLLGEAIRFFVDLRFRLPEQISDSAIAPEAVRR